jgi:hypothetical protein
MQFATGNWQLAGVMSRRRSNGLFVSSGRAAFDSAPCNL